jgi:hypothetical protein
LGPPFFVMSPTHWLISAFIVFHLLSIVVGSTPDPATLKSQVAPDREVLTSAGRLMAPVLDATVEPIRTLDRAVWNATGWCRPSVRKYLGTTKQYQRWNMFSRPMRRHEYMHLRYYIASPQTNLLRVQRELISPGHTGGNVRLFKSFADSFRDKAISLAYDAYSRRLQREGKKQSAAIARERSQVELIPVMRPFIERRHSQLLGPGERLVRVELWRGYAPMPRPGQLLPFDTYERRQEVLAGYDAISDLDLIAPSELAPLGARMEDADIEWGLLARIIWK